ncbi:hypothetical protein G6F32_016458 [Rhizopus arrhizus]|nr:hypothetical protein G6F32_016458 [Rhizopus arrhizus]
MPSACTATATASAISTGATPIPPPAPTVRPRSSPAGTCARSIRWASARSTATSRTTCSWWVACVARSRPNCVGMSARRMAATPSTTA